MPLARRVPKRGFLNGGSRRTTPSSTSTTSRPLRGRHGRRRGRAAGRGLVKGQQLRRDQDPGRRRADQGPGGPRHEVQRLGGREAREGRRQGGGGAVQAARRSHGAVGRVGRGRFLARGLAGGRRGAGTFDVRGYAAGSRAELPHRPDRSLAPLADPAVARPLDPTHLLRDGVLADPARAEAPAPLLLLRGDRPAATVL